MFSNGPRIITDGLVLSLDAADRNSYPGTGNVWYDLSGNNYHFIGSGSYGFSNGAIVFNRNNATNTGTLFSLSNIPNALKIENFLSSSFTIETWIQPQTVSSSLFDATEATQAIVAWPGFHNTQRIEQNGTVFASVWNSARTIEFLNNTSSLVSTITYNHLVGVVNRSSNQSLGYINGILSNLTGSIPPPTMTSAQGSPANFLSIGAARNTSTFRWFYTGSIAIVKLYNRALSADEILQNYNTQKSRFGL
jgi:hypothetical protein